MEQIKEFEYLPDFLDKLGFFSSYGVLIYLLGYEDKFKEEFEVSDIDDSWVLILMGDADSWASYIQSFTDIRKV